ncbi:MAG: hypothetical protein EPO21_02855 [Chloroflexota bacterium]|nr:MAG: hypothetical protein EPO21_02855 [Chloroflexota bacterium]
MKDKDRVLQALAGRNAGTAPVIPLSFSQICHLQQMEPIDLAYDPTPLANLLQQTTQLFGFEAIGILNDLAILPEAAGCVLDWDAPWKPRIASRVTAEQVLDLNPAQVLEQGRFPVVLEVIRRLKVVAGRDRALVGILPEPFTLRDSLIAEMQPGYLEVSLYQKISQLLIEALRKLCENGIDAVIMVADHCTHGDQGPFVQTAAKICKFFGVKSIFYCRSTECSQSHGTAFDAVVRLEPTDGLDSKIRRGTVLRGRKDLAGAQNGALFYVFDEDLEPDLARDPGQLRELMELIKGS